MIGFPSGAKIVNSKMGADGDIFKSNVPRDGDERRYPSYVDVDVAVLEPAEGHHSLTLLDKLS